MTLKALKPLSPEPEVSTVAETAPTVQTAPVVSTQSAITTEGLLALIATMQQDLKASREDAAKASQALADAIIKTTEPRAVVKTQKEIANEKNQELFDKNAKIQAKRLKDAVAYEQNNCEHIAGSSRLSEEHDLRGRTAILWHTTDVGVDVGICLVCQRFFRPTDPVDGQGHDYTYWRKKPSMCKISRAGSRTFLNPLQAMDESYLHDLP